MKEHIPSPTSWVAYYETVKKLISADSLTREQSQIILQSYIQAKAPSEAVESLKKAGL